MSLRSGGSWTRAFESRQGADPSGDTPASRSDAGEEDIRGAASATLALVIENALAAVAHEMNNPLAAAMASQGLALEEFRSIRADLSGGVPCAELERRFDGLEESLRIAQDGVRRTAQVVRGLALLANRGGSRVPVKLVDVVAEGVRWLPDAVSRQGSLRVRHGAAPEVLGSVPQLGQVVARLVANAFQALPTDGSGSVRVTTGEGSAGMARLEISDDGSGTQARTGSAIGLPLCRAVVASCGGTLVARSRPGRGTTVVVELPVAPSPPE